MKKIVFLFLLAQVFVQAQSIQVNNMFNYLRNKDYVKAKAAADAAAVHESTKTSAKMWMYRGNIYKAIFQDTSKAVRDIDQEAEEKALEAYINCLKNDSKNIYKDEMKGDLVVSAGATKNKAAYYVYNKQYDQALKCYDLLEQSLPYDFDGGIKRNNITKEKLMYEKFQMYQQSGNKEKTIEYAKKLIDQNYKEPKLYTDMVRLSLVDKDTAAALSYIEKGKVHFEDNMQLIGTEIDIYLARKKTNVLKDKLAAAIEVAPDNEVLYAVLGQVYEKSDDLDNAEKQYLKALEIKPDFESVNFKLGALYFNRGNEYNRKLNDLGPKEVTKAKEYEEKVKENFTKAIPFLEKAYQTSQEKAYKQRLLQAHTRLGQTEQAAKYK